ncbi:hypothetical protein HII12_001678 [Brettanomyces bruxellensis]|uniref:Uncharacterized protein n=1 Tax=Dekkera bruxellensis TaxID=5007 RepID=A0A8H6BL07_DEKBR|nr:hypothetical protein HII12_001678 [Brettanomyces bruxellensis]
MKPAKKLRKSAFGSDSDSSDGESGKDEKSYIKRAQKRAFGKMKLEEQKNKKLYDYDTFADKMERKRANKQEEEKKIKRHNIFQGMRQAKKRKELEKMQRLEERNEMKSRASEERAIAGEKMVFESEKYKKMKIERGKLMHEAVEERKKDKDTHKTFEGRLLDIYAGDQLEVVDSIDEDEKEEVQSEVKREKTMDSTKNVLERKKMRISLKGGLNIRHEARENEHEARENEHEAREDKQEAREDKHEMEEDKYDAEKLRAKIVRMMKSKVTAEDLNDYRKRYYDRRMKAGKA